MFFRCKSTLNFYESKKTPELDFAKYGTVPG
jgi:hypothetical protein